MHQCRRHTVCSTCEVTAWSVTATKKYFNSTFSIQNWHHICRWDDDHITVHSHQDSVAAQSSCVFLLCKISTIVAVIYHRSADGFIKTENQLCEISIFFGCMHSRFELLTSSTKGHHSPLSTASAANLRAINNSKVLNLGHRTLFVSIKHVR